MRRLPFVLLAGATGYAIFAWLGPRVDPYANLAYQLDRIQAIRLAHRFAGRLGIETTGWWASVEASPSSNALAFIRRQPGIDEPAIAAVKTEVRLHAPSGGNFFQATLSPAGDLIAFSSQEPEGGQPDPSPDEARELAGKGLEILVGDSNESFSQLGNAVRSENGLEWAWEARKSSENLSAVKATIRIRAGRIVEASLQPVYSSAFQSSRRNLGEDQAFVSVVAALLAMALVLAGLCFYVIGALDRLIEHRKAIVPITGLVLFWLASLLAGGGFDQVLTEGLGQAAALLIHASLLLFVVVPTFLALWGAASVLAKRSRMAPILSWDLLTEGRWLARPVGASIAAGAAGAGVLLCIPAALVASGLFPDATLAPASPLCWVGRIPGFPGIGLLWEGPFLLLAIYFAVFRPLLAVYVARRTVSTILAALGGVALFNLWPLENSLPAIFICAALSLAAAEWIYRGWGLLAILAAGLAAGAGYKALPLLLQPSPPLQTAGVAISATLAVFVGAALWIALRGRKISIASETAARAQRAAASLSQTRAVRERLLAEFAVARHAQQLMLPASPPNLQGFEMSSVCRPAREVGGDLFDFIPLQDGKWGVVVADVAGKGVPAALYMTLAKGLLASICETCHQTGAIALELNHHFHFSGRRSVFLTMALGVVDAATGRVECVRAGHNPLIWRRAARNETIALKPSGIGLGLTPSPLFERSLEVKAIQMDPGDALFLYSDGVTEAMNSESEEYGDERFASVIAGADRLNARETRDAILADLERFVGSTPANDDITLVVVRMLPEDAISETDLDSVRYSSGRRPTVANQGSSPSQDGPDAPPSRKPRDRGSADARPRRD